MQRRCCRLARSAEHYRLRAEQLRAASLYASDDLTHDTLAYLAKQYDKMAETRERELDQQEAANSSAMPLAHRGAPLRSRA
jgi:hypothetical protein